MKTFAHFLLTRFNVKLSYIPAERWPDTAWLEDRFRLFDQYCFPSVCAQSCMNFKWLVFFDSAVVANWEFQRRIKTYAEFRRFVPIYVNGFFTQSEVQKAVVRLSNSCKHLITSRLDNDDAIAKGYIEKIQEEFRCQSFEFLNFTTGYLLHQNRIFSVSQTSNPFITLIEKSRPFQTVFCGNHQHLSRFGPIKQIRGVPGWLQVIHGRNLRNKPRGTHCSSTGMAGGLADLLARSPIEVSTHGSNSPP
jgi:hypothetical protein